MLRILLVIEDVNQLNSLKIILSKLGCIVETLGVELGVKDQIMGFRPEVVITAGTGKKVNPLSVTQKVKESGKDIKILLVLGKGMKLSLNDLADNRYDAFIESPIEPLRLISALNQFNKGKNHIDLVEKYQKITGLGSVPTTDAIMVGVRRGTQGDDKASVFGSKFSTTIDNAKRLKTYEELTEGLTISPTSTISKTAARVKLSELQKDWDRQRLDSIDEEKKRFVKELFRKK
jgi:CheY-like chemotaxis protein